MTYVGKLEAIADIEKLASKDTLVDTTISAGEIVVCPVKISEEIVESIPGSISDDDCSVENDSVIEDNKSTRDDEGPASCGDELESDVVDN